MANVKLSQIASGGAFVPSTDVFVTVRDGTTDLLTTLSPGMIIGSGGFTTAGGTFVQYTININNFSELSIQNTNSGSGASSDFVATSDDGTDTTHFIDMGINNSTGGAAAFTNAHAGYLYVVDNELDIGSLGASGVINFYTTGGVGSPILAGSFSSTQGFSVVGHTTFEGITSTGATGTGNLVYSASPTLTGTLTVAAITASGIATFSQAGASSASAINLTGLPFAGTGTTATPLVYFNTGVTQPTTWAAAGTYLGFNAVTASTANFIDARINGGASLFSVTSGGGVSMAGTLSVTGNTNVVGLLTSSRNGSTSNGAFSLTGVWLTTGGSGTTTLPQAYIFASGATAPSTWSTSGTGFGMNAASGFVGNFIDLHLNGGASLFSVNQNGAITTASSILATTTILTATSGSIGFSAGSRFSQIAASQIGWQNGGGVALTYMQTGPSTASPLAFTLQSNSVLAGTSNTAGATFNIAGSQSTGTGVGGSLVFQVSPAGTTGSTVNALSAALTIDSTLTSTFAGNIVAGTAGNGLQVKSGSNARIGTGTLSGGTLAVANTSVTANTRVFLQDTNAGALTNVGSLTVVTTAGTGFTVTSTNVLDTSTFNYLLVESN